MNCNQYHKYESEKLSEQKFHRHLKTCLTCQKHNAEDKKLFSVVKKLKQPVAAGDLWKRIEKSLLAEQNVNRNRPGNRAFYWRIAAVLIIAVGLSFYIIKDKFFETSNLLAESTLLKVEKKEKEYESAIAELEKVVSVKMSELDLELMFLYRDRLETINAQIVQCKEAISTNPANSHIRRYLLMALQDKQETMNELLEIKKSSL